MLKAWLKQCDFSSFRNLTGSAMVRMWSGRAFQVARKNVSEITYLVSSWTYNLSQFSSPLLRMCRCSNKLYHSVQLADQGQHDGCGQSNNSPPACSEHWSVHWLASDKLRTAVCGGHAPGQGTLVMMISRWPSRVHMTLRRRGTNHSTQTASSVLASSGTLFRANSLWPTPDIGHFTPPTSSCSFQTGKLPA